MYTELKGCRRFVGFARLDCSTSLQRYSYAHILRGGGGGRLFQYCNTLERKCNTIQPQESNDDRRLNSVVLVVNHDKARGESHQRKQISSRQLLREHRPGARVATAMYTIN